MQKTNPNIKLYSFDIFDTLITRTTAYPTGIFSIMQKILQTDNRYQNIPKFVADNFFTMRTEAETFVRGHNLYKLSLIDVTLDDIYNIIRNNQDLDDVQIEQLKALELECEKNNIVPVKANVEKLKNLVNAGEKVILISDMYLSSKQIKELLISVDNIFKDIKIYVSNEHNKAKHRGDIYDYIAQEENIAYSEWKHYGDNFWADIQVANDKQILTEYTPIPEFKPYEKMLLDKYYYDAFYEGTIGCARATRINSTDKSDTYEFGVSFAGPILYNYCNWLIQKALKCNLKTLYFVARDGYVLKEITDTIISQLNLDIKTKYIYGSRKAWRIITETNIDNLLFGFFHEYEDRYSSAFLAKHLNLSPEEFYNVTGIEYSDKKINSEDVHKLYDRLKDDENFKKVCIQANKPRYEILSKYLKQELNLDEAKIAFVDISGSGRTQDALADIIRNFYNGEIISLYFHMEYIYDTIDYSKKYMYFASRNFTHFWIELMCRNLDGQTLSYKEENGIVKPILEDIDKTSLIKWGYKSYINGLKDYTKTAINFEIKNSFSLDTYDIFKNLFYYFFYHLDKNTAKIFGSIPYTLVGNERNAEECAPEFHTQNLPEILQHKYKFPELSFISYARSKYKYQWIRNTRIIYGSLRNWLCKIYFNRKTKLAYIRFFGRELNLNNMFNNFIIRNLIKIGAK